MKKIKIFLQVCCGPCATTAITALQEEYDIVLFFWGGNIHPQEEYEKRLEALIKVNQKLNHNKKTIISKNYKDDVKAFYDAAKGMENVPEGGERCKNCFILRLTAAAKAAKENGCDAFATSLSVSPHKDADLINQIGEAVAKEYGISYIPTNLKKNNGFLKSVQLSKELGIYRQNYCGCIFSAKN